MLGGQGAFSKELLHQRVVALGHHLDQLFVGELRGFTLLSRDLALLANAVAVGLVEVSLHRDQVDDAAKALLAADRQLDRERHSPKMRAQALHRTVEAGAVPVEPVDDKGAWQLVVFGESVDLLGLHLHARYGVDENECRVRRGHRSLRVIQEDVEPGRIQQVDLLLLPLGGGE